MKDLRMLSEVVYAQFAVGTATDFSHSCEGFRNGFAERSCDGNVFLIWEGWVVVVVLAKDKCVERS